MVTKIYGLAWLLVAAATGVLFFAGFSEVSLTILGLVAATLVFAGLTGVLPWWVDKHYSWDYQSKNKKRVVPQEAKSGYVTGRIRGNRRLAYGR